MPRVTAGSCKGRRAREGGGPRGRPSPLPYREIVGSSSQMVVSHSLRLAVSPDLLTDAVAGPSRGLPWTWGDVDLAGSRNR